MFLKMCIGGWVHKKLAVSFLLDVLHIRENIELIASVGCLMGKFYVR
jgi:hypothetical protein